jgi:hypothetical protein
MPLTAGWQAVSTNAALHKAVIQTLSENLACVFIA